MPTGGALIEQVHRIPILPNSLAVWGLGQMGIIVKGSDGVLVIDPYFGGEVGDPAENYWARAFPPPLQPTELTGINYYLVSHEHGDHLDGYTAGGAAVASPDMKFVTNGWCVEKLAKADIGDDRIILPEALKPMTLPGTTARVTVTPSAHYEKTYDEGKGYRWIGFWIEWNGVTLYHSGDTIIYPGYIDILRGLPKADIAMIPVNGRDWYREAKTVTGNLLPAEAAQLTSELGWDMVIPGHNDLFPNNAIPNGQIIDAFDRFAPRQKLKFLQPGELYYYVK